MPRTPNVGREEILDRAMQEFWVKGYQRASMDSLVRAIGTTRASLYAEFGGKESLFEAVLDHYSDKVVTEVLRPITDTPAGLDGIESYFFDIIDDAKWPGRLSQGCLMTTTMTEFGESEPTIHQRAKAHFDRIVRNFEDALTRSRASGELNEQVTDPRSCAVGLATFAQGLWACARIGVKSAELRIAVEAALAPLRRESGAAPRRHAKRRPRATN